MVVLPLVGVPVVNGRAESGKYSHAVLAKRLLMG